MLYRIQGSSNQLSKGASGTVYSMHSIEYCTVLTVEPTYILHVYD
jgi:hypothetical protein